MDKTVEHLDTVLWTVLGRQEMSAGEKLTLRAWLTRIGNAVESVPTSNPEALGKIIPLFPSVIA